MTSEVRQRGRQTRGRRLPLAEAKQQQDDREGHQPGLQNIDPQRNPIFAWPNVKTSGSGVSVTAEDYGTNYFGTANAIGFKNPYVMQWVVDGGA